MEANKQQLSEIKALRKRVAELEKLEAENRQKLKTLKKSEERYKTLIDNLHDMVFELSPLGYIQYVSPIVEELYGYKTEDLIGKHLKKTTPLSEVPKALDTLKRSLLGEKIKNFEINQLDSEGRIFTMEINGAPLKKEGKIVGVQGVMRDITKRKLMENELKKKIRELESFDRHAAERELKIIELKKEINTLNEKAGQPKKYSTYG